MKRLRLLMSLLLLILFPLQSPAATDPVVSARLEDSLLTFSRIMASPQTAIPSILLQKAEGIAIIPGMVRASFFVGARFGKGVLMVRGKNGQWSNPVLININGGSFGLQMGLQSTDLVLVFRTKPCTADKGKEAIHPGNPHVHSGRHPGVTDGRNYRFRPQCRDIFFFTLSRPECRVCPSGRHNAV